jgi:hypothetical protein
MAIRQAKSFFITLFDLRFGFEWSPVWAEGEKYLDRFIVYAGGTLRLHKFYRGDDARAPHNHPWWFITFPFTTYTEETYTEDGWFTGVRVVRAWRFHFRSAKYCHVVLGRADRKDKPFYTFVISGRRSNGWGFWPKAGKFVYWRNWK